MREPTLSRPNLAWLQTYRRSLIDAAAISLIEHFLSPDHVAPLSPTASRSDYDEAFVLDLKATVMSNVVPAVVQQLYTHTYEIARPIARKLL